MECVVHYAIKDSRYSQLKPLSDNQYGRLLAAKEIRQGSTELNAHTEQCAAIPDGGFDKTKHGVHLDPCYKKFTAIIARSRKRKPGGVLHYKFIRGCAPQGFLLRPNPRNLVRY